MAGFVLFCLLQCLVFSQGRKTETSGRASTNTWKVLDKHPMEASDLLGRNQVEASDLLGRNLVEATDLLGRNQVDATDLMDRNLVDATDRLGRNLVDATDRLGRNLVDTTARDFGALARKRTLLIEATRYLDNQIAEIEAQISSTAETARSEIMKKKRVKYWLDISYGTSIILANLLYTGAALEGVPQENLNIGNYATIVSNLGYSWGYGGPFLINGQLGTPDPGCGAHEINQAKDDSPVPPLQQLYSVLESADGSVTPSLLLEPKFSTQIVREMVLSKIEQMKNAGSCILDTDQGVGLTSLLNRLSNALLTRLEATQQLIGVIRKTNQRMPNQI